MGLCQEDLEAAEKEEEQSASSSSSDSDDSDSGSSNCGVQSGSEKGKESSGYLDDLILAALFSVFFQFGPSISAFLD